MSDDEIEAELERIRGDVEYIQSLDTIAMPRTWREHLEYTRKRLVLRYMSLQNETCRL